MLADRMVGRSILGGMSVVAAIVVACEPADIEGSGLPETTISTAPTDPNPGGGACEGPKKLAAVDPSTLPSCCDGAHCLPKDKVPGKVRKALAECPGGYCVPDPFLRSGGAAPPTCTALGNPGACASKCIPDVEKNSSTTIQPLDLYEDAPNTIVVQVGEKYLLQKTFSVNCLPDPAAKLSASISSDCGNFVVTVKNDGDATGTATVKSTAHRSTSTSKPARRSP